MHAVHRECSANPRRESVGDRRAGSINWRLLLLSLSLQAAALRNTTACDAQAHVSSVGVAHLSVEAQCSEIMPRSARQLGWKQ